MKSLTPLASSTTSRQNLCSRFATWMLWWGVGCAYKSIWTSALHFSFLRLADWWPLKTVCSIITITGDGKGRRRGLKLGRKYLSLGFPCPISNASFTLVLIQKLFSVGLMSQKKSHMLLSDIIYICLCLNCKR